MDSDMDDPATEDQLFKSDTEPLQPRITIVNIDDASTVAGESETETSELSEVPTRAKGDDETRSSTWAGHDDVTPTDTEGTDEIGRVVDESVDGGGEGGEQTENVGDTEQVEDREDGVVSDIEGGGDEVAVTEEEYGAQGGSVGVGVPPEDEGVSDVTREGANIASHIHEWLNGAIGEGGVTDMESLEDHMRRYIMSALDGIRDDLPSDEEEVGDVFPEEPAGPSPLETDIRKMLVDSLIKLPGAQTGLDETKWILQDLRAWVNTAMGVKNFVTKQTSTSTIDRERRKIDKYLESDDGRRFSDESVGPEYASPKQRRESQIPMSHVPYARRLSRKSPSLLETPQQKQESGVSSVSFHVGDGQVYIQQFPIDTKISDVKISISEKFHVPIDVISLTMDGCPMIDQVSFHQMGVKPMSKIDIDCRSTDPENYPILVSNIDKEMPKEPEYRNVTVQISEETIKEVVVEVRDQRIRKPWVGGYRSKETKCEYHHAFSQTQPRGRCLKAEGKTTRDTQTAELRKKTQNTMCDRSTQMWRRDHYIPCDDDKIITPGVYVTHAEIEESRSLLKHVLTIQRYTRAWLLRRWIARQSREYRHILALEEEAERRRLEEKLKVIKRRITRKTYPLTRGDFDMLYHMVEQWRLAEVARITRTRFIAARKAELYMLLEKEVLIMSCIEKHRIRVKEEMLRKNELHFIDKSSAAITWTGYKGHSVSMETSSSRNAKEFRQLYYSLCNHEVTVEQRINLLMTIKEAMKPFNTSVKVLEVTELLERECDCLFRGLTHTELDMLRMRLRKAFIEFLKDPVLNPDAAKYTAPPMIQGDLKFCELCKKLLPQAAFKINSNTRTVKHCLACCWIDNIGRPRMDYGPYLRILRALRKEEAQRCCTSSIAFVMQEEGFYYLFVDIWKSHSAINKSYDLDDLVFTRWRVDEDWSPWNCILLTYREARAHNRLRKSLEETYEEDFIEDVIVKHQEARVHFRRLARLDKTFRESGRWFNADLTVKYTAIH